MRSFCTRIAVFLMVASGAAGLAAAEELPEQTKPASRAAPATTTPRLPAFYSGMANELNMDLEQRQQLAGLVETKLSEVKAWDAGRGAELKTLQEQARNARAAGNRDAARTLGDQVKQLQQARADLVEKHDGAIDKLLTPQQRVQWEGTRLFRGVVGRYSKVDLTVEQRGEIRQRCGKLAAEGLPADAKALAAVRQTLVVQIEQEVLTPAQRQQLHAARPGE